ncbi:MAG: YceI family protein [Candidatus Omnitrophica bacterium]|nr:YceI family protein [Candidatus Omnitrophota bacterium]
MKFLKIFFLTYAFVGINAINYVSAENYLITPNKTELMFLGTATINAFHGECKSFKGEIQLNENKNLITALTGKIVVDVNMLTLQNKSSDKKMLALLQSDSFPIIVYEIQSFKTNPNSTPENITGKFLGQLSIRKTTLPIECTVALNKNVRGEYEIQGRTSLSLTKFQIKPPTFWMLNKVDDTIGIIFNVTLENETKRK